MRCSRYILTYSGLAPGAMSQAYVLAQLKTIVNRMTHNNVPKDIVEWAISIEIHHSPANPEADQHVHVVNKLSHRLDTTNVRIFDITDMNGDRHHPNIKPITTDDHYINSIVYVMAKREDLFNSVHLGAATWAMIMDRNPAPGAYRASRKRAWAAVVKEEAMASGYLSPLTLPHTLPLSLPYPTPYSYLYLDPNSNTQH